jgi:predicted aspartyl protease
MAQTMGSPQHSLELASQGDPTAIAALVNRALHARGITARVTRKDACLRVLLEADEIPNQQTLVPYLQQNLSKLGLPSIQTVELMGKQACAAVPAWRHTLTLRDLLEVAPQPEPAPSHTATPSVPLQAATVEIGKPALAKHQQLYQRMFTGLIALTLVLIGANLKTVHTLFTKPLARSNPLTLSPTKTGIYEAQIISRSKGVPVIMVTFNGRYEYPMIVDTGAAGTLITQAMASTLGVAIEGQATAQTANGSVTLDVGYITSIEVDGAKIQQVPVAIGLSDMDVGLLGHDFFGSFDVTVREKVVEFSPRE